MSAPQQWRATIVYASAPAPLSDEQAEALTAHLPGFGIAVHDGRRISLEMTVEASTLRKATDEAQRAAQTAYAAAFDVTGTPVAIRVLTLEDDERQLAHPAGMDLISVAEIAELAGVTRQRAHQLTALPHFPEPVADLRSGKIYTSKSVERFFGTWQRKTGRPAKTISTAPHTSNTA